MANKMKNAALLLKQGKINQAYDIYEVVAREQPENKEARFYMYYTLFLKNQSDKEEYSNIKNGFNTLEKEGYIRKEMIEVLSYIEKEEIYE
jgi:thioredoxin-like negative regulator of GroEL